MTDYGYGNSSHGTANNDSFTNRSLVYHNDLDPTYSDVIFLSVRLIASRHHVVAADAFSVSEPDEFTEMEVAEGPRDYDGEDAAEEDRKAMPTDEKSVDFWDKSIRNKEDDSTIPPKGVHLIVSLAIFLAVFGMRYSTSVSNRGRGLRQKSLASSRVCLLTTPISTYYP